MRQSESNGVNTLNFSILHEYKVKFTILNGSVFKFHYIAHRSNVNIA